MFSSKFFHYDITVEKYPAEVQINALLEEQNFISLWRNNHNENLEKSIPTENLVFYWLLFLEVASSNSLKNISPVYI